jgi:hypothetical protein
VTDAANRIVQKLWSYCNVLRDDGLSYQDYLEQLTFLLFLKMADERAALTGKEQSIPRGYRWVDLAGPQMEGARDHLREGPEQDPGSGEAPAAHRGADRQGALALDVGRREG